MQVFDQRPLYKGLSNETANTLVISIQKRIVLPDSAEKKIAAGKYLAINYEGSLFTT